MGGRCISAAMKSMLLVALAGCASQATPPPEGPPAALGATQPAGAAMIAPSTLAGQRVKGEIAISPDAMERAEMAERGLDRVVFAGKVCVSAEGKVASIKMLDSTGIQSYDLRIQRRISEWEYSPYMVDGRPVAACSAVTMIYNRR